MFSVAIKYLVFLTLVAVCSATSPIVGRGFRLRVYACGNCSGTFLKEYYGSSQSCLPTGLPQYAFVKVHCYNSDFHYGATVYQNSACTYLSNDIPAPVVNRINECVNVPTVDPFVIVPLSIRVDCDMTDNNAYAAITSYDASVAAVKERNLAQAKAVNQNSFNTVLLGYKTAACDAADAADTALQTANAAVASATVTRANVIAAMANINTQDVSTKNLADAISAQTLRQARATEKRAACTAATANLATGVSTYTALLAAYTTANASATAALSTAAVAQSVTSPTPILANGPCVNSPCLNGGSYPGTTNFFSCDCVGGFTGQRCQIIPVQAPIYTVPTIITVGTAATIAPTLDSTVVTYSIATCALPAGITFNTVSGVFTATTGVANTATSTNYTCVVTAGNAGGSSPSTTVTLTVVPIIPAVPSYSASTKVFFVGTNGNFSLTVNTAVSSYTQTNADCAAKLVTTGISFSSVTGIFSGTATSPSDAFACTVRATNNAGSSATTTVAISVI